MFKKKISYLTLAMLLFSSPAVLATADIQVIEEEGQVIEEIYLNDGETEGDGVAGESAPDSVDDGGFFDLFNQWELNGYPDNVGYVIFSNELNKMVVGLVDNSPAAQAEILAQLRHGDGVVFEQATYSYNEMMAVLEEVNVIHANDPEHIYGVGFGWAVIDGNLTGFGPSGNELRVTLEVTEDVHSQYAAEMNALYGDKVVVLIGVPVDPLDIVSTTDINPAMENISNVEEQTNYTSMLIIALIAFTSLFALYQRKYRPLKQTTNGTIVSGVERKEVVEAIKEAEIKPREDIYKSIQNKIK